MAGCLPWNNDDCLQLGAGKGRQAGKVERVWSWGIFGATWKICRHLKHGNHVCAAAQSSGPAASHGVPGTGA